MKIQVKNLSYIYGEGSPFESIALDNISLNMQEGEFIGLIGHTGSGKSTLVQQFNGLLKPSRGEVWVDEINTKDKDAVKKGLRQKVGLVFQYPEHQLFEETVFKDVAFGPKNMGCSEEEIQTRVEYGLNCVGLDPKEFSERSPFDLSGGQKRRVAIAGVLAMRPDFLILDEPTAGLDPQGREEILEEIRGIFEEYKITILLVSHSMEDIARLATRIIVMHKGKAVLDDTPKNIFRQRDILKGMGLDVPEIQECMVQLKEKGFLVKEDALTVEEAYQDLVDVLRRKKDA
ncbi:ABC transporter, ATP-binding protein [Peptostreptococcaceae bacterium oral taxon 113 str. W5053]|nr:ABC transporter, ATP-binding protein [Peptostreptococcaceae bacterium oral taxon 113 str. W5053]